MKYLILGSSGLIGSYLTAHLINSDEDVIEYDINRSPEEDLRIHDGEYLDSCINESDFIYFMAFDVGGARYLIKYQDTHQFISNNINIMENVFKAIKKHNKPFVFASSQMSNMYHSNYGLLKAIGESYTTSLNGVSVRFWNVYGFEEMSEKSHVINDFIHMAIKDNTINMLTRGDEERQFLYGEDCSKCLYTIAKNYNDIDRNIIPISSFKWTPIRQIAEIISGMFGGCNIVPGENEDLTHKNARNEPDNYILKYWQPSTSIEKGLYHF